MKKTNKGFSMVELIIVIAIMAILAGALAPALIKYINKSRLSTDIQTGQTVASAIQTALSNESAYDAAPATGTASVSFSTLITGTGSFSAEVSNVIDPAKAVVKSKKDMNGSSLVQKFMVKLNPTDNEVEVYIGDGDHMVFPNPAKNLSEKTK